MLVNTQEQQAIELFIHSHIREDAFDLYGCSTYAQLSFFKTLLSVSGIGPKIAMEILNNDINKIKAAILNEDHNYLCKIPGIGQKTAKRMILELKNKIESEDLQYLGNDSTSTEPHPDAIDALLRLGYQRHHITKTLRNLPEGLKEAEEIITYFLKNI
ncbi:MAG: Holliday junction branch migration protein RuvA [Patescibacteria group bacterium]